MVHWSALSTCKAFRAEWQASRHVRAGEQGEYEDEDAEGAEGYEDEDGQPQEEYDEEADPQQEEYEEEEGGLQGEEEYEEEYDEEAGDAGAQPEEYEEEGEPPGMHSHVCAVDQLWHQHRQATAHCKSLLIFSLSPCWLLWCSCCCQAFGSLHLDYAYQYNQTIHQ